MPAAFDQLQAKHFKFVTVSELIGPLLGNTEMAQTGSARPAPAAVPGGHNHNFGGGPGTDCGTRSNNDPDPKR